MAELDVVVVVIPRFCAECDEVGIGRPPTVLINGKAYCLEHVGEAIAEVVGG